MRRRDLVAIGCSAGGVEALPTLFAQVPANTPAAFAVVQHMSTSSPGHLANIIQRATPMIVRWAEQGEPIEHGHVYLAPVDYHLQIEDEHVRLVAGPRENNARPSINRLFRSVAASYRGRAIGVLLTGMLDDGVLGLTSIQRCGGATVVQDPADASYPDMPRAALEAIVPDHVVGLGEMGALLAQLTTEPAPDDDTPVDVALHARLDTREHADPRELDALGPKTELICPDCGGPMWDVGYGRVRHYRCYLGHANGARSMLAGQANEVERSLWVAIRSLQERASTFADLARSARKAGTELAAESYESQARDARDHAERARNFLLDLQNVVRPDP